MKKNEKVRLEDIELVSDKISNLCVNYHKAIESGLRNKGFELNTHERKSKEWYDAQFQAEQELIPKKEQIIEEALKAQGVWERYLEDNLGRLSLNDPEYQSAFNSAQRMERNLISYLKEIVDFDGYKFNYENGIYSFAKSRSFGKR